MSLDVHRSYYIMNASWQNRTAASWCKLQLHRPTLRHRIVTGSSCWASLNFGSCNKKNGVKLHRLWKHRLSFFKSSPSTLYHFLSIDTQLSFQNPRSPRLCTLTPATDQTKCQHHHWSSALPQIPYRHGCPTSLLPNFNQAELHTCSQ